jgi:hypothetical protein
MTIFMTCVSAQQLPSNWFTEVNGDQKSNNELRQLEGYLERLLNIEASVLKQSEEIINKDLGEWKLTGQKTDLAISKSGLFGFSAVKGTSAVELSWSKPNDKIGREPEGEKDVIELNSEMNERDVLASVKPIYKVLLKNIDKREHAHRSKNFEDHVLRYHRALKQVSTIEETQYVADKFRLDMSVSYSSPLFGLSRLSGDTRVRLEWKIIPSKNKGGENEDQKVVRKILEDVSTALEKVDPQNGYKLKKISIGLGLSKKNLLSFSKVKGNIMGHLFLKKVSSKNILLSVFEDEDYQWIENREDKLLGVFKRSKFRRGIEKSFKMTNWFSKQFNQRESDWMIKKFKTFFTLSYTGFLGLANTTSESAVSFEFSK